MDINKELTHTTFLQREQNFRHTTYNEELNVFNIVKTGDVNRISELQQIIHADGVGTLSSDSKRNLQYLFVAAMTLITRFAIEGGMMQKDAYNLSDLYIQKMDSCKTKTAIISLYKEAVSAFTNRVHELNTSIIYSRPVVEAMDYIYDNLHCNISVSLVSAQVNLSPSYFSSLFKRETGLSIAAYIRRMRIEAAKKMLLYTEYSYQDISNYLCFSSQSHFISIFKKQVEMTPKEYRTAYYQKTD